MSREVIQFVELRLDRCSLTYGVSPCTAAIGTTGTTQCYNTAVTCQDRNNYDNSSQFVLRFVSPSEAIPDDVYDGADLVVPSLMDLRTTPGRIEPGKSLGRRASVSALITDHPHHDRGVDPYFTDRDAAFAAQGSLWTRLIARNPYMVNRQMRTFIGYRGDPVAAYQVRRYSINSVSGPDGSGHIRVEGKDPLKAADDDRAVCPKPSNGVIDSDITASDSELTLSPEGIGNDEYPASGFALISDEIVEFTRSGDTMTLVNRGVFATDPDDHEEGDSVQLCAEFTGSPWEAARDLWIDFANGDPDLIPYQEWEQEGNRWLLGYNVNTVICEPTGVRELWDRLCETTLTYFWWDEVRQVIRFKGLRPVDARERVFEINDDQHIVEESFAEIDDPDSRKNTVLLHTGIRNPATDIEDGTNYRGRRIRGDLDAISNEEYGDLRILKLWGQWFRLIDEGAATRLTFRTLARYRDGLKKYRWMMDAKDVVPKYEISGRSWGVSGDIGDGEWIDVVRSGRQKKYVSIAASSIVGVSGNGDIWERRSLSPFISSPSSVAYAEDIDVFCLVASDGIVASDGLIALRAATSIDAFSWTTRGIGANEWRSVTRSLFLARFVSVASSGTNRVAYSTAGESWTSVAASDDNAWWAIESFEQLERLVAVAKSGTNRIMYSDDAESWTGVSADTGDWTDLAQLPGSDRIVVVGESGDRAMYSDDAGETWAVASGVPEGDWQSVEPVSQLRALVAIAKTGPVRVMWTFDGESWIAENAISAGNWMGLAYSDSLGRMLAVGDGLSATLDVGGRALDVGAVAEITTRTKVDFIGRPQPQLVEIVEVSPDKAGHRYAIEAVDFDFTGRYAFIMEDGAADYGDASDELQRRGAWFAPDGDGFANGDLPYRFI